MFSHLRDALRRRYIERKFGAWAKRASVTEPDRDHSRKSPDASSVAAKRDGT